MFDVEKNSLKNISNSHSYAEGFNGKLTKYRALKIKGIYSGGGNLLDIGAGEGILTQLIADSFEKIVVVEPSPIYINKAKIKLHGYPVSFYQGLIEEFDTKDRFDLIIASGILEHVINPHTILNKIRSFLKDNGIFIAIVPNATSLHRQIGVYMKLINNCYELQEHDFKVGHRRYYDLKTLEHEILHVDLKIVESGGILLKILPNKDMEKLTDNFCDALFEIGNLYPVICAEVYVSCKK